MEPLTLTLLGYPLSVFVNLSYDALKKISNKTNLNFLKKLFISHWTFILNFMMIQPGKFLQV